MDSVNRAAVWVHSYIWGSVCMLVFIRSINPIFPHWHVDHANPRAVYILCLCVWVCIMTASQLSRMLKCQPRVQVLTCPHVLLSPVAATGIKLSHIFSKSRVVKNRSATAVGSAVGWWLCTVTMYHAIGIAAVYVRGANFHKLQISARYEGKCLEQSVKGCERHSSTDKIIGSLVSTTDWQGYVIKKVWN